MITMLRKNSIWKPGYGFEGFPTNFRFRSYQAAYGFVKRQERRLDDLGLIDYYIRHEGVVIEPREADDPLPWVLLQASVETIQ